MEDRPRTKAPTIDEICDAWQALRETKPKLPATYIQMNRLTFKRLSALIPLKKGQVFYYGLRIEIDNSLADYQFKSDG